MPKQCTLEHIKFNRFLWELQKEAGMTFTIDKVKKLAPGWVKIKAHQLGNNDVELRAVMQWRLFGFKNRPEKHEIFDVDPFKN